MPDRPRHPPRRSRALDARLSCCEKRHVAPLPARRPRRRGLCHRAHRPRERRVHLARLLVEPASRPRLRHRRDVLRDARQRRRAAQRRRLVLRLRRRALRQDQDDDARRAARRVGRPGDRGVGGAARAIAGLRSEDRGSGEGGGGARRDLRGGAMKVLMTADTVGGVWTYAMELTRALRDTDFVIATMGGLPSASQLAEVPPNARVIASGYKLEWQPEPWDDVARAGEWLLELEDREHPDYIHLNGYAHGALPFRAPKCVVAHSCVMSWWRAVKNEDAPVEWERYRVQVTN